MPKGLPKSYIKKYGGINKRAWAAYRAAHKKKKTRTRKTKTKRSKKRMGGKGGKKLIGNLGLKGIVFGAAILTGLKYLVRNYLPQAGAYTTAVSAAGAGLAGSVLGVGSKSLLQFGIVDGVSELIYDLVTPQGAVTLPFIPSGSKGGYEF